MKKKRSEKQTGERLTRKILPQAFRIRSRITKKEKVC